MSECEDLIRQVVAVTHRAVGVNIQVTETPEGVALACRASSAGRSGMGATPEDALRLLLEQSILSRSGDSPAA